MAEPLVSGVLEQLAFITTDLALQEVRLIKDVDKNISSLKKKLELIQGVLEDAERKQLGDAAVRSWLQKLTDVSYDIDDVLDEWRYEILKSKIQKQMEADQKAKKKVCLPLIPSSSCFCVNQLKQLRVRRDIAHRIKELNETLEEIAKERRDYSLETTKAVQNESRETISFVDESQIYGLDGPKNALIEKLLNESSEGPGGKLGPAIIPIVGMGGLGKTTLAQLAFNDAKMKTHFHERIWACVSDPFDEIKIAKAIIESLKSSHQNLETLEALFQHIRERIEGKKFFLVLDDVWSDNHGKWENFIQPFRCGAVGSIVLVTTRKREVANMMGAATQMITLELLSDEYCWSIFSGLAFRGRNSGESKTLETVGREIVKRYCKGLPLAAKTLGGLMCSKQTEKEWVDVLSSRIWQVLQGDEIEHFAPFFLSYYDLSPREKRCFSYCSVFPKDYDFTEDELIGVWMSQGYFSGSQNPEKEGETCLQILSMRSFFQDFQRGPDGSIEGCKMHDILHDFAQFLTRNECSTISVDMEKTDLEPPLSVARHSTLLFAPNFPKIPTLIFDQSNMRSLFIITTSYTSLDYEIIMVLFHQTSLYLKHLRTLYLSRCPITKVPKQIGQLIHLRYLNLSGNQNLRELPDEVCDLFNLQTLNIRGCLELQSLPKGMGKLLNLRHLYNYFCDKMKGLPKEIGRLTQLRTLEGMIIPKNNEVMYLSLEDLKRLNHLRYQRYFQIVNCSNLISLGEIEESVLGNWEGLVGLKIDFGHDIGGEQIYKDEFRILEALQPRPSLIVLGIRSYKGTNLCPRWMMSLVNLRRLFLSNCNHCETLPPLGSLPSLKKLELYRLEKVRKIGVEFLGTKQGIDDDINVRMVPFPKLEYFDIYGLDELEEWEGDVIGPTGDASGAIMPCLNEIEIQRCGRLKSLPEYLKLTPLKKITIADSRMLSESLMKHSEKEWHKIFHIPTIIIDRRTVRSDGKWDSDESANYCVPKALLHNENEDDLEDNIIELLPKKKRQHY